MIRRKHVAPNFFGEAEAMRDALDVRFKDVYTRTIRWQYFCDPLKYAYLRTEPRGVFPKSVFDHFMECLRLWCTENLGLVPVGIPLLHLMVNGCRLGLHSDFHNGAWGYVYSLTRWQNRRFSGGETLLLRDGTPSYKKHHAHGDVLYELIPAHFNQLLVFDDRIVHATPTIEGSMDPIEGRIALVGHIRATSPVISGNLDWTQACKVVSGLLSQVRDRIRNYKDVQGTVTYRLTIAATGTVEAVTILTDNVVTPVTGYDHSDAVLAVKALIQRELGALRFPAVGGKSSLTLPLLIPIPDLQPIKVVVQHHSTRDAICEWITTRLAEGDRLELRGTLVGETVHLKEPLAGTIRIEPGEIVASFDPPMWVPSQREQFQTALTEWMKTAAGAGAQPVTQ